MAALAWARTRMAGCERVLVCAFLKMKWRLDQGCGWLSKRRGACAGCATGVGRRRTHLVVLHVNFGPVVEELVDDVEPTVMRRSVEKGRTIVLRRSERVVPLGRRRGGRGGMWWRSLIHELKWRARARDWGCVHS
jgi:hypothetical protein